MMKALALFLTLSASALFVRAQDTHDEPKPTVPERRVVVTPFENKSKFTFEKVYKPQGKSPDNPREQLKVDRLSQVPREDLEDIITQMSGVKPVERDNLDAYLMESGRFTEIDPRKVKDVAVEFHADAVVIGTITEILDTTRQYSGYNVKMTNKVWLADVRIRVFEMKDKKKDLPITFSKKYSGSFQMQETRYSNTSMDSEDYALAAVHDALEKVREDSEFQKALRLVPFDPLKGQYVDVPVSSDPNKADVTIDGRYVGKTPCKVHLQAGSEVAIRIERKGYQPWDAKIVPTKTLVVDRELEKVAPTAAVLPTR